MPGGDGAGHVRGAFFPWAAPETGDYFLEFRSINGITGRYVLTVLLGVPGAGRPREYPGRRLGTPPC